MKKVLFLFLALLCNHLFSQNGSPTCEGAEPACSDNSGVKIFPNVTGQPSQGNFGCMGESPNGAWFYIKVGQPGDLAFNIIQNTSFDANGNATGNGIDVDFVAWGPFATPDSNCENLDTDCVGVCPNNNDFSDPNNTDGRFYIDNRDNTNIIDCSWSGSSVESFTIPNAQAGEFYVLLVSNWPDIDTDGTPGFIKLEQTNLSAAGAGTSDCSIVVGELGPDQEVCVGTTVSLDATPTTGTIVSYEWQVDTGSGFTTISGETNATLDIQNNLSGTYKVILTDADGAKGEDEIGITFFEIPVANPITINEVCDTDRDGFHAFDFDADATPQILDSQSATDFEVLYFKSMADATANISGTNITNPYTNSTAFTAETIYARIHNKGRKECGNITSFTIQVRDVPVPVQPSAYRICDDIASGSDTDKTTNSFLLSTRDSEILGLSNSNLQFNVSYHSTLVGAQTDNTTDVIDKTMPHSVTNSQLIYVRVENKDNPSCAVVSDSSPGSTFTPLELIVDPLPVVNNPAELIQCHNDPDLDTTVNLKLARINISSNYLNETFEYYATEANAIAGTPQITGADIEAYPVVGTDQVWVRTISDQNCYRISKVDITVNFSSDLAYDKTFIECDDFLDIDGNDTAANDDTDGITRFDFSKVTDEIKAFFPVLSRPDLDVFYYESITDRTASLNDINSEIANHRNNNDPNFANNQTIYIKIVNNTNNGCSGTAKIFLQVDSVPIANNLAKPLTFCDDFNSGSPDDGEIVGINLRSTVDEILGNTQTETDYIVTYHTSQADATSGTAPIVNDTNFRNTAPAGFVPGTISRQTIFVRVTDRTKIPACYNDHVSFEIEIIPLPALEKTIAPIEICDVPTPTDSDPRNRVAENIDLTQRNTDILNGRDPTNYSIQFYKSQTNALNNLNPLSDADLINYKNDPATTTFPSDATSDAPGIEIIFFTITDASTGCTSIPFTLELRIYPEPNIPVNINNYVACDTNNNGLGDDTDGILENIALSSKLPEILANYPMSAHGNFTVTYHKLLTDAQSGSNALNSNTYKNETNNQLIFVRVLNNQTGCVNDDLTFEIKVNPLPSYAPLNLSQIACLNNLPLTLEVVNPLTAYDYRWVENQTGTEIGTASSVAIRAGGNYTLTVTDRVTFCERIEQFEILESEAAKITREAIFVIDDTSDIRENSFSISIDPTNFGIGDYEYALVNEEGNFVKNYQDEPKFEQLSGGFYTLLVRDKKGCDISRVAASIEVPIVEFPKFFTPNGDGIYDTWAIKGINSSYYPASEIYIYNRFGKVVAKVDIDSQGWDGTYDGKILPSDDYWFSIQLVPFDTTKKPILKTGNFSLLRK